MKYIINGQSGIGKEIIKQLINNGDEVTVISSKNCEINGVQKSIIKNTSIESEAQEAIEEAISSEEDMPDIIINTVGVLYNQDYSPEKKLDQLNKDWLLKSIEVNTLPTAYLAKYLSKKMKRSSNIKFLTFSAHVGCISDNTTGGWHSYRMSKCALNMLIRNICNEWKFRFQESSIYGYHPGTVSTDTFNDFQKNIDPEYIITPEQAAKFCIENLNKFDKSQSGKLIDYQGNELEY